MIITAEQPTTESTEQRATDEALDHLSPEEIERLKYDIWTTERVVGLESTVTKRGIVAEGDSWFDYRPGIDILDHLTEMGHAIAKVAKAGDSLENMVYGTEYDSNFSRRPNPLDHTITLMNDEGAKILLFSGGGNDIAGDELGAYLNHKGMGTMPLRDGYVDYVFGTVVSNMYTHLVRRVLREVGKDVHIIAHGYGLPIPDGRAVINVPFLGWRFIGPWLRPALTKKNYVEAVQAGAIMKHLVNRFNNTLARLATNDELQGNFHYIDLRQLIQDDWWANELHLKNSGYRKVAAEFDRVIREVAARANHLK